MRAGAQGSAGAQVITLGKYDVLALLEELGACEKAKRDIARLPDDAEAHQIWGLMPISNRSWFLRSIGAEISSYAVNACDDCDCCGIYYPEINEWDSKRVLAFLGVK